MALSLSLLGLLLLQVVDASSPSAWEQSVEANAAAWRSVIAAASSMKGGWGDSATGKVSYDAYSVSKLVEPQSEAYIPLLKDVSSAEVNTATMKWFEASMPAMKGTVLSTKQEIDWIAVVLGSEGKTLLSKTNTINKVEEDGKTSTVVSSYLSRCHFDDDNKAYKDTDFFPLVPSSATGCVAEILAAPAEGLSTAAAFCAGALTSAALAAAMLMGVSWKKRTSPTTLQSPLMVDS